MHEYELVREALSSKLQKATAIADQTGLTVPMVTEVLNQMVEASEVQFEKVDSTLAYKL